MSIPTADVWTSVPDDVMKAALAAAMEIQGDGDGSEDDWVPHYDHVCVIARAIMAERERCASIAQHLNGWGADCGRGGHAEHIAKIIRKGEA